ncbi:7350_t:CDS:2 [Acaulospora morrowiae]|uniref:7350_t:CDS:1 n=1 Tax=Acaulospora morrowiae TaxID=94023 RepID=A0A9N9A0A3_9GLOM|nr:7350_t:CDS:2 [Acaulospora morrowiae]
MSYPNNPPISFPQPTIRSNTYVPSIQRRPSSSPSLQKEISPPLHRRGSTGNSPMSSIENTVTQLLFTTKSLLEALTSWSNGQVSGQQVSDVYVKLGSELNKVVRLFGQAGVDMSDMTNITQDLRGCLERALGEVPSPASLEQHLPSIRDIIVKLLQGLKAKQSAYRQLNDNDAPQLNSTNPQISIDDNSSSDPMNTLKSSKNIERRASRRHSIYTMQKSLGSKYGSRSNRGGLMPPRIVEKEEDEITNGENDEEKKEEPVIPHDMSPPPEYAPPNEESSTVNNNTVTKDEQDKTLTLYLQLGKDVKKIKYDGDISISALRILFIEKFQYNPGMDDFPNIYIREPQLGILYELEDLREVKNNSVLALNVEALEQVKKHIDQSISELTREIRDVKKSIMETELKSRVNVVSAAPSPSASQFRSLAKKVVANVKEQNEVNDKKTKEQKDELVAKITNDLRNQFNEVQNLRRDLGVIRQVYTEFQGETKKLFESLGAQTASVKNVALTNVSSSRTFIEEGKTKLNNRTSSLLTKVNELQDIIDELKVDVTQRRAKPRETTVQQIRKDAENVEQELDSLQQYVKTVKPTWKKTWEEELQSIVDEQKFLNHQEELIEDLQEDNKKVTEVLENILKVVEIQVSRPKEYFVKPKEEGFEGLKTVLQEIKGIPPDHERRLKALEQSERMRERELANRIDEFEAELSDFVSNNKLKKTGGAQEIERLRQKKNEDALKELFKANKSNPEDETP